MTLLVAIYCDDGVVIAGDQMATRGNMGLSTVGSPVTKVSMIKGGKALYAFSGYTGLGHHIGMTLDRVLDLNRSYFEGVTAAQNLVRQAIGQAAIMAGQMAQIVPNSRSEAVCGSFLAAGFSDGIKLIEISPQGAFDPFNEMRWACIGSGQANADPFMSFLWSVYWKDRHPKIREAVTTAYWAIKTVIKSGTAGVGFEVDVFTLAPNGGLFEAKQVERAELDIDDEFIESAMSAMRSTRDRMNPSLQQNQEAKDPPVFKEED